MCLLEWEHRASGTLGQDSVAGIFFIQKEIALCMGLTHLASGTLALCCICGHREHLLTGAVEHSCPPRVRSTLRDSMG